jgi:hypothetical protein
MRLLVTITLPPETSEVLANIMRGYAVHVSKASLSLSFLEAGLRAYIKDQKLPLTPAQKRHLKVDSITRS